jgi:hypothetical protein
MVVGMLAGVPTDDYFETVRSITVTRRQLPWVMAVGGLLLVVATALTTWMITLYSSFRLAGPLYRFSLDLQKGIDTGRVPAIKIRRSDFAQTEARLMEKAFTTLYEHHAALDAGIGEVGAALEQKGPGSDEVKAALGTLAAILERAKP